MKPLTLLLGYCALVSSAWADLPANYDLRSAGEGGFSWVPAIQNQSEMEDCWTFATATALDSALIKAGYLPTSTTAPDIVISSWHLSAYNGQQEATAYNTGNSNTAEWTQWGGFYWQSMSYLTRGSGSWPVPGATAGEIPNMGGGPVTVAADPLNAFPLGPVSRTEDVASYLPPVNQPVNYQVTGVHYFNQSDSSRDHEQQVEKVKQVITKYGAAGTYMYADGYTENNHKEEVFNKVGDVMYAYYPADQQGWLDHAVTIIGWDDTVQVPGASTPGAWIVQNSWGAWGGTLANKDGTFYASYEDKYIGRYVTTFTAKPIGNNSSQVLQNEVGPIWQNGSSDLNDNGFGKIDPSRGDRAISILDTNGAQTLTEVGLYSFKADKSAKISIYGDWDAALGPANLLDSQNVDFEEIGYTLFSLDDPVDLGLYSKIIIEVIYDDGGIPYVYYGTDETGSLVPPGLSYYLDTATDEWVDLGGLSGSDTPGVFFIKGIVAVPEPSTFLLLGLGLVFVDTATRRKTC